ncbi:MAG: hypothetical protein NVS1B4_00400 [Gemmatimonadaceae bacterium]
MREVELKSVVDDIARRRALIERAGATLVFEGRLEDRRYDTPARTLLGGDQVLRVRVYRGRHGPDAGDGADRVRVELDWKGPTTYERGYKVRDELGVGAGDDVKLAAILEHVGFIVTRAIDREIAQYVLEGAVVRFERYPRMDSLVEVEGSEHAIEHAISILALPRQGFTAERLPDFVARYERRTGSLAALCDEEFAGTRRYDAREA